MKKRLTFLTVLMVIAAGFGAGGWTLFGKSDPKSPNIILIVIDTLRRDHVGAYGYGRATTPTLDEMAAEGVTFADAYANSDWTKPSVASLLTGLYPSQHGVTRVVTTQAGEPPMTQKLPDEVTTLAEALKSRGYFTLGIVDNVHISAKLGFAQGFDIWDENNHAANVVTSDVLYRLEAVKEPFFLYLHYFDPHAPYLRTRLFESKGQIAPGLIESDSTDYRWSTYMYGVDRGIIGLSPIERERLEDLYDGEVRSVDIGIGRIIAALKDKGLFDNAWIIITADHGENFNESKRLGHPHDCFSNSQMRVPLVMKMPARLGVKELAVPDQVQLVDIVPTILGYTGAARPAGMVGVDLMPAIAQRQPLPGRAVAAQSESGEMLLVQGRKFVDVPTQAGDFQFVYDEARDPLEERNIAGMDKELAGKLKAQSEEIASGARRRQTLRAAGGVALSNEEIERMKALGYIH